MAKKHLFRFIVCLSVILAGSAAAPTAWSADAYPEKPISVIVPFGPGGSSDISCRVLMKYIGKYMDADIAVLNLAGAAGTIGSMQAYQARPDGYTLLYHHLTLLTSYHTGVGKFTWDSLTPVAQLVKFFEVMTTRIDAPWKDVHEFVEHAKKNPEKIKWGVSIGAGLHFAALSFATSTNTRYQFVAGGGDADQTKKLLGGHIDVSTPNDVPIRQYVQTGKLRVLGVMSKERIPSLPDSPTLKEQGIDAEFYFEPSLYGPPGLPREIVEKLEVAAGKAIKDPACIAELEKIGMYPAFLPQAEFKNHLLELDARLYKFARVGGLIPSRLEKK